VDRLAGLAVKSEFAVKLRADFAVESELSS
jgi:hypothetical protein